MKEYIVISHFFNCFLKKQLADMVTLKEIK